MSYTCPSVMALRRARRVKIRTMSRRYSCEPRMSDMGELSAAAFSPASSRGSRPQGYAAIPDRVSLHVNGRRHPYHSQCSRPAQPELQVGAAGNGVIRDGYVRYDFILLQHGFSGPGEEALQWQGAFTLTAVEGHRGPQRD